MWTWRSRGLGQRGARDTIVTARHTEGVTQEIQADAVVVAAGSSRRMGGQDKLEAEIVGRSVLRWSVEAMASSPRIGNVVVVAAPERVAAVRALPWIGAAGASVVPGGSHRQASVAAGVQASRAEIVLVHDAARPFVSSQLIERVVDGAHLHGAVIPVLPVVDALKRVEGDRIRSSADRAGLFRAQTPQGARRELLVHATTAHADAAVTIADEAELLALDGIDVHTVPGDADNMKVTLPEDLELARRLAAGRAAPRFAQGRDSHPFGPEDGLRLGGLIVEDAPRLYGHSDGDVALHALCDALLAAAGLGDLGRLFPSGEQATRGIDSRMLVAEVMTRLEGADLVPSSADLTILAARPRLGGTRLDAMAETIAQLLGLSSSRVSVTAASGNLSGDEGAGRAISATCLVSLVAR